MATHAPRLPQPRTLADQFRRWSSQELSRLLEGRPDLAVPAPRDSAQLASRAVVRSSVQRAMESLNLLEVTVLRAVAQIGPTDHGGVAEVVYAEPDSVDAALDHLRALALVWGTDPTLRAVTTVTDLLAVPHGPDAARIPGLIEALDPNSRAILDHLDRHDVDGEIGHARPKVTLAEAANPTEQLLARGLLAPHGARLVTIPWTVRLSLRGARSTHHPVDAEPALATSERDPDRIDRAGAGAAFEFTRRTETLLEHWGQHPPAALRAGGLGVRELKATATLLQLDLAGTALVVETAASAGLLAVGATADTDAVWLPTDMFDIWQSRSTAQRWHTLVDAWLGGDRLVGSIGGRDGDKPINALSPGLERGWIAGQRAEFLTELRWLPTGHTLAAGTGVASLLERARWQHPRRSAARLDTLPDTLDEAAALGLLGLGGMTGFGRSLLEGDDPERTLAGLLPAPVDHILLQADLTAVAPGPLEQDLARKVALVADVESRGGATVYRFTAASVRRAYDAGWSAGELHDFVANTAQTPVPQGLTYLIDDVARRFGTVRVGQAESFLRSDDEVALTALLHNPEATTLRLRRIAPSVVVSDVPLTIMLPRLRELGMAPVVEAADGTVRVARPDLLRARTPRVQATGARTRARTSARTAAVVTAIRSGDRLAAERPSRGPARTPADVTTLLRAAIEDQAEVRIGYLDKHGTDSERLVRPSRVEGGRLTAYDERSDDVREFALHRITTASLAGQ